MPINRHRYTSIYLEKESCSSTDCLKHSDFDNEVLDKNIGSGSGIRGLPHGKELRDAVAYFPKPIFIQRLAPDCAKLRYLLKIPFDEGLFDSSPVFIVLPMGNGSVAGPSLLGGSIYQLCHREIAHAPRREDKGH